MKRVAVVSVLLMLSFSACKPSADKEISAFIGAKDEILSAWAKEVDTNPTEAGVDNMRKLFESKKADLITKKEAFLKVADKAGGNPWTPVSDSQRTDRKIIDAVNLKFPYGSPAYEKFRALEKDYLDAVNIPNLI